MSVNQRARRRRRKTAESAERNLNSLAVSALTSMQRFSEEGNHAPDFSHDGGVDPVDVGAFLRPGVDPVRQQGGSVRRQFPERTEGAGHQPTPPNSASACRATSTAPTAGRAATRSRWSITSDAEKIHTARAEQCRKNGGESDACHERTGAATCKGSIVYASWKFLQRNAKVTYYAWAVTDNVEGQRLQLTNPDGSRTFAAIYRHGTRLYILEGTVPRGAPAPGLFQQSLMWLDEEGKPIRYRTLYTTGYTEAWRFPAPPPPRTGPPPRPQ